MMKLEGMKNDQMARLVALLSLSFGFGASFIIRHSCFVIALHT